jgi:hypothetical protein
MGLSNGLYAISARLFPISWVRAAISSNRGFTKHEDEWGFQMGSLHSSSARLFPISWVRAAIPFGRKFKNEGELG